MDLLAAWLIGPALCLAIAVGLSLLVERLASVTLPWTLRPALGLAALVVIVQFATTSSRTAELAIPAAACLAVVGGVIGRRQLRPPSRATIAVAGVVFVLYAAPFLALGEATWAGYVQLDDSATWMAITDHAFERGRGLGSLAPSTQQMVLDTYLGKGYPIGGFVPAGSISWLSGQDIAFTLQPGMAVTAMALALVLFELVRRPLRSDLAAGAVAVVASLSSLLLGYYLWAESKELFIAALLPLLPAIAFHARREGWPVRAFVAFGVAVGGLFTVLGLGAALWVAPIAAAVLYWLVRERGRAVAGPIVQWTAMLTFALVIPVAVTPEGPFNPLDKTLTEGSEVSVLGDPLNPLQVVGLWPATDFRDDPHLQTIVVALAAICALSALVSVFASARLPDRAGVPFACYLGGGAVGAIAIAIAGSPWVDAKAMATLSPGVLCGALLGFALLARRVRLRIPALAASAAVVGVVAWSAFLAYHGGWFAPRAQYEELAEIGERFAGQGPALANDASYYGVRHFIGSLAAESPTDVHRTPLVLDGGRLITDEQGFVDIGDIEPSQVSAYNLIVVPNGPPTSRPPNTFQRVWSGRFYDVWRRIPGAPVPAARLALGGGLDSASRAPCERVARLADSVGSAGSLVAAKAASSVPVQLGSGTLSPEWERSSRYGVVAPTSGVDRIDFEVPGGRYDLLLGGKIFGEAEVLVDGELVGSARMAIYASADYLPLGELDLEAGSHELELRYSADGLHPGTGSDADPIGPILLVQHDFEPGTVTVPAAGYRHLCDRRWDWIEGYPARQ